jgi:hypothetical protein
LIERELRNATPRRMPTTKKIINPITMPTNKSNSITIQTRRDNERKTKKS